MTNLVQNLNQTFQTPMLAQVTMDPQPNTVSAQIDPASTAAIMCAGCAVKLITKAGYPNIVVDICSGVTDGPVYGIIPFNPRKNRYAAGDTIEVVGVNGVLMLKSSAAIVRGANVAVTPPTVSTDDPVVTTTTTVNDYVTGIALGQAAGAAELIKVQVRPAKITSTGVLSIS